MPLGDFFESLNPTRARLASGSPAMMIVETRAHVRLLATHPGTMKLEGVRTCVLELPRRIA